jgi:ribosomal protein S18 acetylase RimI-like enzyme
MRKRDLSDRHEEDVPVCSRVKLGMESALVDESKERIEDIGEIRRGFHVTLRHGKASDLKFIERLSGDVFTVYGRYEDVFPRWFQSGKGFTIIAYINSIRVGFAMLGETTDRYDLHNVAEVLGLAVEPERQSQGVGSLLLKTIDNASISRKIDWLFLHTAIDNIGARRLYERLGYRNLEIKRGFYPEGQDAIVMYKELKDKRSLP